MQRARRCRQRNQEDLYTQESQVSSWLRGKCASEKHHRRAVPWVSDGHRWRRLLRTRSPSSLERNTCQPNAKSLPTGGTSGSGRDWKTVLTVIVAKQHLPQDVNGATRSRVQNATWTSSPIKVHALVLCTELMASQTQDNASPARQSWATHRLRRAWPYFLFVILTKLRV